MLLEDAVLEIGRIHHDDYLARSYRVAFVEADHRHFARQFCSDRDVLEGDQASGNIYRLGDATWKRRLFRLPRQFRRACWNSRAPPG